MNTSLVGLWQTMGWFPRAIVFVCVLMALFVIAITITKLIQFTRMSRSTRKFAPQFSSYLKEGKISSALELVKKYEAKSHIATVLGVTLREVKPMLPYLDKKSSKDKNESSDESDEDRDELRLKLDEPISGEAVEAAERAVEREQVLLASNMKSGLSVMATVGATAPFVGLLGTVLGVIHAFTGMSQAGGGIAMVSAGIAEALITTAVGLLVAIPSVWLYNYFNNRLNTLFSELAYAGREMVDWMMGNGSMNLEADAADFSEFGEEEEAGNVEGLDMGENGKEAEKKAKKE